MSEKRLLIETINKSMFTILRRHAERVGPHGHLPLTEEEAAAYNLLGAIRDFLEKL